MAAHNDLGKRGEDLAAAFLEEKGYQIFERNYRFLKSEIDIVAFQPYEIIFVEVKTRGSVRWDYPEAAVTPAKQNHIKRAAEAYLYERKLLNLPARFDIIALAFDNPDSPDILHIEDAFR